MKDSNKYALACAASLLGLCAIWYVVVDNIRTENANKIVKEKERQSIEIEARTALIHELGRELRAAEDAEARGNISVSREHRERVRKITEELTPPDMKK